MKIVFAGLGGVGGYYGAVVARFLEGREEDRAVFLARGEHLEAIRDRGLRVVTPEGEFTARPSLATDRPSEAGVADVLVVAVKGYDLESAGREFAPLVDEHTVVLPLLNGVNSPEILRSVLPPCRMLNGCVYISSSIEAPGVIRQTGGSRKLFFGPPEGKAEDFRFLEEFLRKCGIDAALLENVDEAVWTKFIFLSPFAGVTSLFHRTFGEVLAGEDSLPVLRGMMQEIETIARMKGISLPPDIVDLSLEKGRSFPPETKSSMQLDCERGRRTEADSLLGFVVVEGERLGADVPLTRGVYDALLLRASHPCGGQSEQRP